MFAMARQVRLLLDLRDDTNYEGTDEAIRQNVNFKSANAWTLVFAIMIASVGLNVNSTAVIIGAMLISPLMGPIVGAGYALGVNDFLLLKNSGRNLLYAVCISLVTSTIYFLISPYNEVQSELLARTSPNFYDVVIAIFGGAAGIVASSRSEKSNAIPGVAIATALMPPLCTAGFGIATLEWKYFLGAIYLFVINTVFICLSTYVFVRYLKFKKVSYANPQEQVKINRWIIGISTVVVIPSLVTAWLLLSQSAFKFKASKFVDSEIKFKGSFLIDKKFNFDFSKSNIQLTLIGAKLDPLVIKSLNEKMGFYGLEGTKLQIDQVAIDEKLDAKATTVNRVELSLKQRIATLESQIKSNNLQKDMATNLVMEIQTFNSKFLNLYMNDGLVMLIWKQIPKTAERKSIEDFIKLRVGNDKLVMNHSQLMR